MDLGRVGVWSGQLTQMSAAQIREVAPEIESLGFRTLWFPESFTKEAFAHAATLLAAGSSFIAATGIANILARDATAMINGARTIEDAFPGRLLLGIGVSHASSAEKRGAPYNRPLRTMIDYLDAMEAALWAGPKLESDPPIALAALGPKMLELAARRTKGAHPYFVPVQHTAVAREVMGSTALLAPEQAVVLGTNPAESRAIARDHAARYLRLPNYRNNLVRLGWSDEETNEPGSDDLIDAIVAWGDVETIQSRVAGHLEAGADHVGVQVLNGPANEMPMNELRALAPALLEL